MDNDSMNALALAWRDALAADGWTLAPTYSSEPLEHACKATTPDGWIVQMISRPAGVPRWNGDRYGRRNPEWGIHAWAPDSLAVRVPVRPDVAALRAGVNRCGECGAEGVTVRLGFAGRVCPACRAKLAPHVEYPGWYK